MRRRRMLSANRAVDTDCALLRIERSRTRAIHGLAIRRRLNAVELGVLARSWP